MSPNSTELSRTWLNQTTFTEAQRCSEPLLLWPFWLWALWAVTCPKHGDWFVTDNLASLDGWLLSPSTLVSKDFYIHMRCQANNGHLSHKVWLCMKSHQDSKYLTKKFLDTVLRIERFSSGCSNCCQCFLDSVQGDSLQLQQFLSIPEKERVDAPHPGCMTPNFNFQQFKSACNATLPRF